MSHFTKIETQLVDEENLQKALEDLGVPFERNAQVRGYAGQETRADFVVRQPNEYDVGFIRNGETFELVADDWGLKIDKDEFLNQVMQRYAYHAVVEQAKTEGFTQVREETTADGSIRLVYERPAEAAKA